MREVQSIEVCARTDLVNSLKENTTQTKSKRAIKLEERYQASQDVSYTIFREFDPGSG
jgi:hypothetical protein